MGLEGKRKRTYPYTILAEILAPCPIANAGMRSVTANVNCFIVGKEVVCRVF